MNKRNVNIGSILQALRGDCRYIEKVQEIYRRISYEDIKKEKSRYFRLEEAKSFFIYLVLDCFKTSEQADIILCAWGLLKGYQYGKDLTQRRKYYLEQRENYNKEFIYKQPFNKLTVMQQKSRADALRIREDEICNDMGKFFDSISDKKSYIDQACRKYIMNLKESTHDPVLYPNPSYMVYARKTNRQIIYVNRARNLDFCGRENELKIIEENFLNNIQIQLICGMGGSGKTQLALQYLYLHKTEYNTIIWINAKSASSIIQECKWFLLESLEDNTSNIDCFSDKEIIVLFKRFINNSKSTLLVMDNVDYLNDESAEGVLQKQWFHDILTVNNCHIIVTTQCDRELIGTKRIRLDVFDPELSTNYLEIKTGLKVNDSCRLLVQELGYLPLALDYVSSYIAVNKISYDKYLELFINSSGLKLLNLKSYSEKTILQTFRITLNRLKESNCTEYNTIEELLKVCAFFGEDYLPLESFLDDLKFREKQRIKCVIECSKNGKSCIIETIDINNGNKVELYNYINYLGNGRFAKTRITAKTLPKDYYKGKVIIEERSPLLVALDNELSRHELIRKLTDYSLINWDGEKLIMHQLLRKIIVESTSPYEQSWRHAEYSFSRISNLYSTYGDKELSKKYQEYDLCDYLYHINSTFHFINTDAAADYILILRYSAFQPRILNRIIPFGNEELIKASKSIHERMTRLFYQVEIKFDFPKSILEEETIFWKEISSMLGRSIVYRDYKNESTAERAQNVEKNHIKIVTSINDYNLNEYAYYFIDILLEGDYQSTIKQLEYYLYSNEDRWYSIALPKGITLTNQDLDELHP